MCNLYIYIFFSQSYHPSKIPNIVQFNLFYVNLKIERYVLNNLWSDVGKQNWGALAWRSKLVGSICLVTENVGLVTCFATQLYLITRTAPLVCSMLRSAFTWHSVLRQSTRGQSAQRFCASSVNIYWNDADLLNNDIPRAPSKTSLMFISYV